MGTQELAEKPFAAALGAIDMWSVYVGEQLGLYEALVAGPHTVEELSAAAPIHPRYAREWLGQQTATGILAVDDPALPAQQRRYRLSEGHAEVLTERDSLAYLTPFMRLMTAAGLQLPALLDAYRGGGGVNWSAYGPGMRSGQADMNRPWFLTALGSEWFPAVPELHARLTGGGRVADIGCGEGWSAIAMAKAYPAVEVDGYDLDEPRWPRPGAMRPRPASPTACTSPSATRRRPSATAPTTWSPLSSASTTWPSPWRCSPRCAGWPSPTARSWSWTSASTSASARATTTSSA